MESLVDPRVWSGRRVFVTGHTGFMGGWLALWLKDMGAVVHGYALDPATTPNLFAEAKVAAALASDMRADIRDVGKLGAALAAANPEIVFHLAAQPLVLESYRTPVDTFAVNVMGTVNVLEAARKHDTVRGVLVVTSDKCYANDDQGRAFVESDALGGHDPYSASKACAEIVAGAYRDSFKDAAPLATARAGNIIGGGDWAADRLVPDAIRALVAGKSLVLRHPGATRPWQHVLEAVAGYLVLMQKVLADGAAFAGPWNFGPMPGASASVGEVAAALVARLGGKVEIDPTAVTPREARMLALDSAKAAARLGWQPRWTLDRTLAETADWYAAWRNRTDMAAFTRAQIARYAT